ncbi:MAG: TlpA family protein disulfide reductase [Flammeovirgaceae bacterium]|nr:TlpA family protein disulfide reductase [Flammeovirgaceae bacterium]
MKTTLIICLILVGFLTHASAPKSSLSGKIELPESVLPNQDIHVNLYVGINPKHPRERWGEPMQKLSVKAGKFNIDAPVGNYFLSISSFNCNTYELPIVIGKDYESLSVKLSQLSLPQDINKVDLYLLNKGEKRAKKFEMVQKGNKWLLKDSLQLEKGQQYFFILNDNNLPVYRPDKLVNFCYEKSCFQNIYNNGEIEFEPHQIPQPYVESIGQWKGNSLNPKYSKVAAGLNNWEKESHSLFRKFFKGEITETDSEYITFMENFDALRIKYGNEFPQLFLEKKLGLMEYFDPVQRQLFAAEKNDRKTVFQSGDFTTFLNTYFSLVNQLDPYSPFLKGDFIRYLISMDRLITDEYFIKEKQETIDISHNSILAKFDEFLDAESPYAQANIKYILSPYLGEQGDMERAEELLNSIKEECPYFWAVKNGIVDSEIRGMKLREGATAPEFSVLASNGDSISLGDLKGKFVFIDFWGTWCGPCIGELPNIKDMVNTLPIEQFQVIGLMQDNEKSLRKFLSTQSLPYPNAIAKEAVKQYGVTAFPTTFLIAPDGKIIAKNLRGKELAEKVKEKIAQYQSY